MKAVLLDVMNDKVEVVDAEELEDYYKLIGCRTIETVNWEIMGRRFDIVCDEEGLFFENPKISSIDDKCNVMSVGNLVVCGEADDNGRLTSLYDEDVRHIMGSIKIVPTKFYPDGYRMICHVNP